jgi:hypothetical protein
MNDTNELKTKTYRAMRSLFRYAEMQQNNYPDVLIKQEETILQETFKSLSAKEILYIIIAWPEFLKKESIDQEILNVQLFDAVKKELNNLN